MHRFAARLKAGTVRVSTLGPTDVRLPRGAARESGFGRKHGAAALEKFTAPEAAWINTCAEAAPRAARLIDSLPALPKNRGRYPPAKGLL